MAVQTIATLKTYFETTDRPTEAQFIDLIDTMFNVAGAEWLSGSGAPSGGTGDDGDFYLDTATGDVYKKVSGSWGAKLMTISGAQGVQGPAGPQGPTGATGATGPAGPAGAGTAIDSAFHAQKDTSSQTGISTSPVKITFVTENYDVGILTVLAAHIAPGEEDSSGPAGATERVFLAKVGGEAGKYCMWAGVAGASLRVAIDAAGARAEIASVHPVISFFDTTA